MKKLLNKTFFATAALVTVIATSCTSLQDVYVDMDELEKSADIQRIERTLAFLDGEALANGTEATFNQTDFATNCIALAKDAEQSLSVQGLQKIPQARLLALEGRAYHLGKNDARAKALYAQANSLYAGDVQNAILASRLGLQVNLDEKQSDSSETALLILEKAIIAYTAGNYADSAAAFDTAFLSLNPYYKEAYGIVRNKAWELRSVSGANSILVSDSLTVMQMISLTQENTNLLFNYTAGKKLSDNALYKRVSDAGLLNPVSQPSEQKKLLPTAKTLVTRILAARYLWNLYATGKEHTATRYSNQYGTANAPSPIADIPVTSPDFDAVLGCVENEFLSLSDGEHFNGDVLITAIELNDGLRKIR